MCCESGRKKKSEKSQWTINRILVDAEASLAGRALL